MKLSFLKGSNSEIILPIRFIVLFGIDVMGFQKVSGIGKQEDVEWVNEGGVNGHPIKLHTPHKSPHQLRFSRGVKMNSISLSNLLMSGGIKTNNYGQMGASSNIGTIIVLNAEKDVKAIYGFISRGVLEWEVNDLDAQAAQPLIETFTVAHDGLYNIPVPDFL